MKSIYQLTAATLASLALTTGTSFAQTTTPTPGPIDGTLPPAGGTIVDTPPRTITPGGIGTTPQPGSGKVSPGTAPRTGTNDCPDSTGTTGTRGAGTTACPDNPGTVTPGTGTGTVTPGTGTGTGTGTMDGRGTTGR